MGSLRRAILLAAPSSSSSEEEHITPRTLYTGLCQCGGEQDGGCGVSGAFFVSAAITMRS